jgi:hypothetical protein
MPIRMLRDWTRSKKMAKLSSQAERLFTRLIQVADDFGNYPANIKLINGNCFSEHTDILDLDVAKWLDECATIGVIRSYTVNKTKYIHIVNFGQRLDKAKAKYPREHEDPDFVDYIPEDDDLPDSSGKIQEVPGSSGKIRPELETEIEVEIETEREKSLRAGEENPFVKNSPEFNAWNDWLQYRKEKKQKLTPSTAKLQLKFLQGRAGPEVVAIINQSITAGWTGLFELKDNNHAQTKGTHRTTSAVIGKRDYTERL